MARRARAEDPRAIAGAAKVIEIERAHPVALANSRTAPWLDEGGPEEAGAPTAVIPGRGVGRIIIGPRRTPSPATSGPPSNDRVGRSPAQCRRVVPPDEVPDQVSPRPWSAGVCSGARLRCPAQPRRGPVDGTSRRCIARVRGWPPSRGRAVLVHLASTGPPERAKLHTATWPRPTCQGRPADRRAGIRRHRGSRYATVCP